MEKCLSWINIRPNEQVVDLVTSPIFLLQIVVKFVKGLCFFFRQKLQDFWRWNSCQVWGKLFWRLTGMSLSIAWFIWGRMYICINRAKYKCNKQIKFKVKYFPIWKHGLKKTHLHLYTFGTFKVVINIKWQSADTCSITCM